MCIIKKIGRFIKNGAETFREASSGVYRRESSETSEMRRELFKKESSPADDKANLRKDLRNVRGDFNRAYEKIVLNNG